MAARFSELLENDLSRLLEEENAENTKKQLKPRSMSFASI
jgi:hypothetical protein